MITHYRRPSPVFDKIIVRFLNENQLAGLRKIGAFNIDREGDEK
jgi:hypothetical protein